ncbi:MAG: energy transducer TonB [Candidatus Latescibacterota bacterium]
MAPLTAVQTARGILLSAALGMSLLAAVPAHPQAPTTEAPQPVAMVPETQQDELSLPEDKQEILAALATEVAPRVLRQVLPVYPRLAQRARLQGTVFARVLVDTTGHVVQVGAIRGSAVFRSAVAAAARQWEFAPATQGGRPVSVWVTVPFAFEL